MFWSSGEVNQVGTAALHCPPTPPPQVRRYRKLLLEKCLDSLREPMNTSVASEGMEALAKILGELREGDLGPSFGTICEQCRAFFDNVSLDDSLAGPWPSVLGRVLPKGLLGQRLSTSSPLRKRPALGQRGRRSALLTIPQPIVGSCGRTPDTLALGLWAPPPLLGRERLLLIPCSLQLLFGHLCGTGRALC